ncbi:MAG: hypothetical protein JNL01_13305 [Bdellovibrionales bacterium]|nr:hypothetical protein [Bdellovibrionales bacterium]
MPLFETLVYSLVVALGEIFPVSANAHVELVSKILGWNTPSTAFLGVSTLGTALGILIALRHDWASIFSALIQVILFRKKPMTFDERLPFFLLITTGPVILGHVYLQEMASGFFKDPLWLFAGLVLGAVLMGLTEIYNRKLRGMFDWNAGDSFLIGISQLAELIPGLGRTTGVLFAGMARNYHRNVVVKFQFYAATPVLIYFGITQLRGQHAIRELGRVSFYFSLFFTTAIAALATSSFVKNSEYKKLNSAVIYRICFVVVLGTVIGLKAKGVL